MADFPSVPISASLNTNAPAQAAGAFTDAFEQAFKQARIANAMKKIQAGDTTGGIGDLYQANPQLALQMQEQLRTQQHQNETDAATRAADQRWLRDHPEDSGFIGSGGHAKDANQYDYTSARTAKAETQTDAANLKASWEAFGHFASVLSTVKPGDPSSGGAAKAQAMTFPGLSDDMKSYISALPDAMSAEQIASLSSMAVTRQQSISNEMRAKGLDIRDKSVEYGHQDRQASIAQSNTNNIRTTETSAANNVRTTENSAANNQRTTSTTQRGQDFQHQDRQAAIAAKGKHHFGGNPNAGKTIVAHGTAPNGRKVVKYSDGTIAYDE